MIRLEGIGTMTKHVQSKQLHRVPGHLQRLLPRWLRVGRPGALSGTGLLFVCSLLTLLATGEIITRPDAGPTLAGGWAQQATVPQATPEPQATVAQAQPQQAQPPDDVTEALWSILGTAPIVYAPGASPRSWREEFLNADDRAKIVLLGGSPAAAYWEQMKSLPCGSNRLVCVLVQSVDHPAQELSAAKNVAVLSASATSIAALVSRLGNEPSATIVLGGRTLVWPRVGGAHYDPGAAVSVALAFSSYFGRQREAQSKVASQRADLVKNPSASPSPTLVSRELRQVSTDLFSLIEGNKTHLGRWVASQRRPTVVNVWASWCAPCVKELPVLADLHLRYSAQVLFVGVAAEAELDPGAAETRGELQRFLTDRGVKYVNYIASEPTQLREQMGNTRDALPYTVVYDKDGRRVFLLTGVLGNKAGPDEPIRCVLDALLEGGPVTEAIQHCQGDPQ